MKYSSFLSLFLLLKYVHAFPLAAQISENETRYWDEDWTYGDEVFEKREVRDYTGANSSDNHDVKSPLESPKPSLDSQPNPSTSNIPCTGNISHGFGNEIVTAVCTEQLSQELQDEFPKI
ncbi:hypothetical protein K7432_011324 [Basidiobolus ranarum]|uniref:Uncharacterized protein n=1 Tax=Basidiobolus ranarum TaxID=34480 RepID=A0ABR2VUK7_9FUNG